MSSHKKSSKEEWAELRNLLCDWDPIGVMADPEWPRDEYDCLIGPVLHRLMEGVSAIELADYLRNEITDHFGLNEADYDFESVARRITTWFRERCV